MSESMAGFAERSDAAAGHLERVARLRRQIGALQAAQAQEVAAYLDARTGLDEELDLPAGPAQYRSMTAEVAIATGLSVLSAQRLMADAYDLARSHPHTLAALRAGDLLLGAARAVVAETRAITDPRLRALADQLIAAEAVDVLPGKVRALAERRVIQIDPDAATQATTQARADRHLRLVPGLAGTAYLEAFLPAEQAAACHTALRDQARAHKAAGDPRTLPHLMCDLLHERLTGTTPTTPGTGTDTAAGDTHATGGAPAAIVTINLDLVMTDRTLLGLDHTPAHLIGIGPLPADIARLLAGSHNVRLRRLFTDPVDGTLLLADSRRRCYTGTLRDLIRLRDQHCQGIRCPSPITTLDHIHPHAHGGPTAPTNAQGLSQNCHTTRDHPHMTVNRNPHTRVVTWHTPTGLTHKNLPPPPLGPGSLTPQQIHHRHQLLHPPDDGERSAGSAGPAG
jgi:hypothetical protein